MSSKSSKRCSTTSTKTHTGSQCQPDYSPTLLTAVLKPRVILHHHSIKTVVWEEEFLASDDANLVIAEGLDALAHYQRKVEMLLRSVQQAANATHDHLMELSDMLVNADWNREMLLDLWDSRTTPADLTSLASELKLTLEICVEP